jgi:pyrimidine operon attenuation protein/uracil phosphoribosyltransferase|tara:strand:+ start:801 stop:1283 length:483 start_codon:yes stop_codon:yes gene_type:complete
LDINKALFRLSKEITESEFSNPLLIGIPRRGDLLAKRLSNNLIQFNYSHDLDTVDYLPFRDDLEKEVKKTNLSINPQDREIILIDDVIYTGRTLRASIEAVVFSGRPKSISLLCLIDRGHRELPISPKFIGKNIPTNENEYVSVFLQEIDDVDKVEVTNI